MAIDGALVDKTSGEGIYVGADHIVEIVIYADAAKTTILNTGAWTLLTLDIRKDDKKSTVLLTVNGTRSGTFNASPGTNTEKWSFTVPAALLAKTIFKGDESENRFSIWRRDAGSLQPVRFGDATITRTTQA